MNQRGRKNGVLALLLFLAGTAAFAGERWQITAELNPGSSYSSRKWFGIIPVKLVPQIALWIENEKGDFIASIYSSKRNSENNWRGADERSEALPVYNSRRGAVDAIGGASPKGNREIILEGTVDLAPGRYYVYGEVNKSFDYNERYPEEKSGVNGQPALVYRGLVDVSGSADSYRLALLPFGTGSLDGSDGAIRPGTEGLTSALRILDSVELVLVRP
jgi:hypothetical protein